VNKKQRAKLVFDELRKLYPSPKTELENWKTEFQFLVCVMLSAQTTDIQVNKVTGKVFEKFPDMESFAQANVADVEELIHSINFYKTKSKHLIKMSQILIKDFDSKIPPFEKELMKLPGVGKKTANVFLNELFHSNEGIAVDTHVSRVAQRLDLTERKDPQGISLDLEKLYEKKDWYLINSMFVLFGRYVCKAKKPLCSDCPFNSFCKIGLGQKKDPQI
jgi:endonuclease III